MPIEQTNIVGRIIRRPVAVSMFYLTVLALGLFAFSRLPIELH